MNSLKIVSILGFALICFSIALLMAFRFIKYKAVDPEYKYGKLLHTSALFIGVSIMLNLVFQKVSYLYDIMDQYSFGFWRLFSFGSYRYGLSPEMTKVTTIYLALAVVWNLFAIGLARLLAPRILKPVSNETQVLQAVIFLSVNIALYPVVSFILDNFYVVLENPVIY